MNKEQVARGCLLAIKEIEKETCVKGKQVLSDYALKIIYAILRQELCTRSNYDREIAGIIDFIGKTTEYYRTDEMAFYGKWFDMPIKYVHDYMFSPKRRKEIEMRIGEIVELDDGGYPIIAMDTKDIGDKKVVSLTLGKRVMRKIDENTYAFKTR